MEERFTVFVGGVEVNDYLLTESVADDLAQDYTNDGYDDVEVVDVTEECAL
jgi:hypothetical protein